MFKDVFNTKIANARMKDNTITTFLESKYASNIYKNSSGNWESRDGSDIQYRNIRDRNTTYFSKSNTHLLFIYKLFSMFMNDTFLNQPTVLSLLTGEGDVYDSQVYRNRPAKDVRSDVYSEWSRIEKSAFEGVDEAMITKYKTLWETLREDAKNALKAIDDSEETIEQKNLKKLAFSKQYSQSLRNFFNALLTEPTIVKAYEKLNYRARIFEEFKWWTTTFDTTRDLTNTNEKDIFNQYLHPYNYDTRYYKEFLALLRKNGGTFTDRTNANVKLVSADLGMYNRRILKANEAEVLFRFYEKVMKNDAPENTKYTNIVFKASDAEWNEIFGDFNIPEDKIFDFLLDFSDFKERLKFTYTEFAKRYANANLAPLTDEELARI